MEIIADLIKYIHYLLFIFVLTGNFLLPIKYLKYYILLIIFVFLDWNDLDGQCILTKLEHYFRTGEWDQKAPNEGGPQFFRPLVNKIFDLDLTINQSERLNYFIFISCLLIAYSRIFNYIRE